MSHPSLSQIKKECQEILIQAKIHIQKNSNQDLEYYIKLRFGEEVWHRMILDDIGMDVVNGVRGLFVGVVFGL